MRVGMLIWTFWPGPEGGAERQCRHIISELSLQDFHCVVITSRYRYFASNSSGFKTYSEKRFGLLCPLIEKIRKSKQNRCRPGKWRKSRIASGPKKCWHRYATHRIRILILLSLSHINIRNIGPVYGAEQLKENFGVTPKYQALDILV